MATLASQRVAKSRENNDYIAIRPPLALGREIRDAAAAAGVPIAVYVTEAVQDRMRRDKRKRRRTESE